MATQTRPSFYLGEQPQFSGALGNDPMSGAFNAYNANQAAIGQQYQNAQNKGLGGWIQSHPVSSSLLSSLLIGGLGAGLGAALSPDDRLGGALGMGLAGAAAGPLYTGTFSANRQGRLADAYNQSMAANDARYKDVIQPYASGQASGMTVAEAPQNLMQQYKSAFDYAQGNSYTNRQVPVLPSKPPVPQPTSEPQLAPMDYSLIPSGGELPAFSDNPDQTGGKKTLSAGASQAVPPALMQAYESQIPTPKVSNRWIDPQLAIAILSQTGQMTTGGGTAGNAAAVNPSQIEQNYGAANASNANAGKAIEETKYVAPLATAEEARRRALAYLYGQQAGVVQKDSETRRIQATRPVAGSQPNPLSQANTMSTIEQRTLQSLKDYGIVNGYIDKKTGQLYGTATQPTIPGTNIPYPWDAPVKVDPDQAAFIQQYTEAIKRAGGYQPPAPASAPPGGNPFDKFDKR